MTSQTRRRVLVSVVAVALTLPAETILLKALETPTPQAAAQQYAASLAPADLAAAASSIQSYPFAYRRAIMTALTPAQRSQVWQNHLNAYLQANPGLDPTAAALIQSAIGLASPQNLAAPTDDSRAQIDAVANQIQAALGKSTAQYLLYQLGPSDGTFASAMPISERLANTVRGFFVAIADSNDCSCNLDWGCPGGLVTYCADGSGCSIVTSWPACGWLWDDPCNGACKVSGLGGS